MGGAVAIPDGDTTSQDALSGAAVNVPEDLRGHAKLFQPPVGEEALTVLV